MKRVILATTSLVVAGGMAAADVTLSGSAELGVSGEKGKDAKLHKDLEVAMALSGATDTGVSFGGSIDLDEAATKKASATVFVTGVFGTLTLGNTDGAFDAALTEVGAGGSIADNHTGHPGYSNKYDDLGGGNSGLDGFTGNPGHILRYDYSLGGVTVSASGEFSETDSSDSSVGVGVAWSGDVGGIGMGIGLGWQNAKKKVAEVDASMGLCVNPGDAATRACDTTANPNDIVLSPAVSASAAGNRKANILGMSASADMGNGFSVVANYSKRTDETVLGDADTTANTLAAEEGDDTNVTVAHTGVGIAYSVGEITVGVNGGTSTTKTTAIRWDATADTPAAASNTTEVKATGIGVAVVYSLGTGASLQFGAGSGKNGDDKVSSWSAGLSFSF